MPLRKHCPILGGGYAVSRLRELLQDTPENRRFWGANDEVFASRSKLAVIVLESMFPEGPRREPALRQALSQDFTDVEAWAKWIDDHQENLRRLPPTETYQITNCPASTKRSPAKKSRDLIKRVDS